ncbi:MAG: restriction endonuclease [Candidatus Micrarchaeota archaeon]|nr:restriction endonuclease [Candidatus Micrarchaeota archaeon]
MNEWIKRSIEIANAPGYLDALSEIYPMNVNPERPIPNEIAKDIGASFAKKNTKELIRLLIENSEVFPVKDSYVGFIRKKPEAIDENPVTIKRIGERLYSLGFDRMMQEAQRPKETNRQLGHSFKNWVSTLDYDMVDYEGMKRTRKGTVILKGSDNVLGKFARKELRCKIKKGIDLVVKKDTDYIVGEAKFLTTPGGEQDRGFDDASSFISARSGNATRIALIDGYIWLKTLSGLYEKIKKSDRNIMSALLLKNFISKF